MGTGAQGRGRTGTGARGQCCTGTGCMGTGVHRNMGCTGTGVYGGRGAQGHGMHGDLGRTGKGGHEVHRDMGCMGTWSLPAGASFSHSLSSGLSTALAVLCHELPHELGDLAVLLRAGMAPRTLLLLNLLSALLSCLGAAVGAAVGQSAAHLTPWILTGTAGTFLYVALADMLPEALRGPGEGTLGHFILQNAGFLLGGGIMLGIALAEGHVSAWLQP
uniref:Uncharacterized protein n=1 Tax=Anser brachyrhynchus TaxID=132585 RepID=A0A8B9C5W6_9AVES